MINNDIIKILICPDCSSKIKNKDADLYCVGCSRKFKFYENILDLRPKQLGYDQVLADQSFSKDYKELMSKKLEIYEDEYSKADIELIDINDPFDETFMFLEIGCGRGRVSNAISKKYNDYKNFQTIGIDLSQDALILADKIAKQNSCRAFYIRADIEKLPFDKNSINLVFGGGSFEHFKNTDAGIKSITNIMKRNGQIILTLPCISITTLVQGMITGNTPDFPLLKQIYNFIHSSLLKDKYRMFGFEYSFLPKKFSKKFEKLGIANITYGYYDVKYDLKFVPFAKKFFRKILKYKFMWPMFFIKIKNVK